ncbi:MAG: GGDEF domain-containing protein [Janthinobacterium lividum]
MSPLLSLLAKIKDSTRDACLSSDLPGEALHCFADMTALLCRTRIAMIWLPASKHRPQFFTFGSDDIDVTALDFMSWFGFTRQDIDDYVGNLDAEGKSVAFSPAELATSFDYFCKVPIVEASGTIAGVLCIADGAAHAETARHSEILAQLASQIGRCLDLHNRLHISERRAHSLQHSAEAERLKAADAEKRLAVLHKENEILRRLSETDSLTGIKNRRAFDIALSDELERLARMSGVISVMMIDVDEFKQFNDSFGHIAGDDVLKTIALLLQSCLRPYDHLARFGGEEFAIIFYGTTAEEACHVASRLHQAVRDYAWTIRPVTISIGVASSNARDHNDTLLHRADSAMYRAKKNGRNRMEMWESPITA